MELLISIAGVLVGLIGLGVAIYQNHERARLRKYVRASNWYNYQRANNTNGITQNALETYKTAHDGKIDIQVLELLSKADAFGQDLFKEHIRQIQLAEPSFKQKDFDRWKREGKLSPDKEQLFVQYSTDAEIQNYET